MADTYLTAAFKDKERVKSLGAKWDAAQRSWYVPAGLDLTPFEAWLPMGGGGNKVVALLSQPVSLAVVVAPSTEVAAIKNGTTLSQLLAGVAQAVAQAFKEGVWTLVEVVDVRLRNGHVYIEVSERAPTGAVLAKTTAVIWATTANRILPEFERATGAKLAPGIKLLVRARPVFKAQFGFSLELDAIDPEYTLGDLEAKKKEIRARLQREGVFDANRKLPAPWDYSVVIVVAPPDGAGLGDFKVEAERLERFGICTFIYAHSRFQGEGAAMEIRQALSKVLDAGQVSGVLPADAVVIIRGGGAVNDLAWLNDYALARFICDLDIPVLTGIGHERDSTVLDEVANLNFDTPSKVIAGIEQVIAKRVDEARAAFAQVTESAARGAQAAHRAIDQAEVTVRSGVLSQVARARQGAAEMVSQVRMGSLRAVRAASECVRERLFEVRHLSISQLSEAKQAVPGLLADIRSGAGQAVRTAKAEAASLRDDVIEHSMVASRGALEALGRAMDDIGTDARRAVVDASAASKALMREIAGQGPEKSLGRGFAIVRGATGQALTTAAQARGGVDVHIQFRDGEVAARTTEDSKGMKNDDQHVP